MTPWDHSISTSRKYGGRPSDYIEIHDWFDCTKQYTGDWGHRMLRHHAAGIQWVIEEFGHYVLNSDGKDVPTKLIAEQHVKEDCGFVPTVADWTTALTNNPKEWMLKVQTKKTTKMEIV